MTSLALNEGQVYLGFYGVIDIYGYCENIRECVTAKRLMGHAHDTIRRGLKGFYAVNRQRYIVTIYVE